MDSLNKLGKTKAKSKKKKQTHQANNFIEALKGLSSSAKKQAKDASLGIGRSSMDQLLGSTPDSGADTSESKGSGPMSFEDYVKSREKQAVTRERTRYRQKIERERLVFHRREQEAKLEIKAIQEELNQLAKETDNLSQEVKKAVFNAPAEAGTYYDNFFERIKKLIELARKKIAESKNWLQLFNQRGKKRRSFYWQQAKKSGTKYTLSQERRVATKVG